MRVLPRSAVVEALAGLCQIAACDLPVDVFASLRHAMTAERSPLGRSILSDCLENAGLAHRTRLPLCQDTGSAVVFADLGEECRVEGGLESAIQAGIAEGYTRHHLRASIVRDPLFARVSTGNNTPAVIHVRLVPGKTLRLTLAPKGGGSENMTNLAMLVPSAGRQGVLSAVVNAVKTAGGNPCPPVILGVGVGGTAEQAILAGKRALLRPIGEQHANVQWAEMERDILTAVNALGIGPQGLGGTCTALAVHLAELPCHIASLPVATIIGCHCLRHAAVEL